MTDLELTALRQCAPHLTVLSGANNRPMFDACSKLKSDGRLRHIRTDTFEGQKREVYAITPSGFAALQRHT